MATPAWESGRLYAPGALVVPRTTLPAGPVQLPNGGFDADADDWILFAEPGAVTEWVAAGGYQSPGCVRFTCVGNPVNTADGTIYTEGNYPVTPGQVVRGQCYAAIDQAPGGCAVTANIVWFDSDANQIGVGSHGTPIIGVGGYRISTVSGNAPGNAAYCKFVTVIDVGNTSGTTIVRVDNITWSYVSPIAAGLQYRAVQPAAGLSGAAEPAWPGVVGQTVVDNEVIWEAVLLSRVVWQARSILRSGPDEPDWPASSGAFVVDNTISWRAVSRRIEDPNCPESDVVVIAASAVYAADGDIVRKSATVNPLDWTTPEDAGYLAAGLQQFGANPIAAMNLYRSNLVPFNAEAFQMWQIDEDIANASLLDALPIGCTRHQAMTPVSNDLLFLSSQGVRSVGIAGGSTNLQAGDVGMPIDPLVQEAVRLADEAGLEPFMLYFPAAGQCWLVVKDGEGGSQAFVYTMTRVGQVGAWSRYLFPYEIDDWAIKGDDLYLRAGDKVFRVSDELVGDRLEPDAEPVPFEGVIQWPYLDFGQPGVTKRMFGIDVVCEGQPRLEVGYDQTNRASFTPPYLLPADTVPGRVIPFQLSAPSLSIRLRFDGMTKWHFLALNVYLQDNRITS